MPNKFILYVGDCNWNKNVPVLIKAAKELKVALVLVGKVFTEKTVDINHPWNKSLKEVFELSSNDSFIIKLGYISDSDLVNLYNLASIYVQPSFYEGFGLSVIEALACGCPVLSSTGGSLAEVAGEAVEYFNPLNLNELVSKVTKMLQEPDLKNKGLAKRLNQAKKFTPLRFVEGLNEIYNKIT